MIKEFRGGKIICSYVPVKFQSTYTFSLMILREAMRRELALFKYVLIKRTQNLVFKDKTSVFRCIQNR